MQEAGDIPMEYSGRKMKKLEEFVTSRFPNQGALMAEKNHVLSNPQLYIG